jgi:predicted dienelactone hydrolase
VAQAAWHVGLRAFDGVDPLTKATLPMVVYYPTLAPAGTPLTRGGFAVDASPDAPVADGRFPLVVFSHGHMGSMWQAHDLCEALARHGYVTAAVEHIGDDYGDQSGFRTDRMLLGRAYQLSALIDAVLADGGVAPHVDRARIGAAGFSAGGGAALVLAGARVDFDRLGGYCQRHPGDDDFCAHGPTRITIPAPAPAAADPRVRAAFAIAPLAVYFGPHAFDAVTAKVFLAWATDDRVLMPEENAESVRTELHTLAGTRVVRGAGHYVFLPPCSAALAAAAPRLCVDAPGIDRSAVHAALASDAAAFFDASL